MHSVWLLAVTLLSFVALAPMAANAADIGRVAVTPGIVGVPLTTSFTLEIRGTQFIEALDGGGLDVTYDDSIVSLDSIDVGPLWDVGVPAPSTPSGAIGDLFFLTTATAPASFPIAYLHFTAIASGTSPVSMVASTTNPFAANGRAEAVMLGDGTVMVPEPHVLPAFIAGCALLGLLNARTRSAANLMNEGGDVDAPC